MRIVIKRWLLPAAGLACYVAFAWCFGGDVQASRKVDVRVLPEDPVNCKPTPVYYGSVACSNKGCHGGDPPKVWVAGKPLLVRGIESLIWQKCDKHGDSYAALLTPRGKQMAKILGYDVTDAHGKGRACMVCHAVVIDDPKVLAASKENHFSVEEGITCVVCHGAADEWVGLHGVLVTARKFRNLPPEIKEARYGMRNLWDPVKRTELCTSCHVGSQKEGKFVTHEMYAAGHPPLPAFEVASFSDQMPRHWQYRSEKCPPVQIEQGLRRDERERTQMVLVGAIVSFRDTMNLLAGQAEAALRATNADEKELDLSNFDCYSCHHGIRSKSWQRERMARPRIPGWIPGRVPMRGWSTELLKLAIRHFCIVDRTMDCATLEAQFQTRLIKLEQAFNARAFGSPALIKKAAADLAAWSEALACRINKVYPTTPSTMKLLASMPGLYNADRLLDYDSAREVSWAFSTMYHELFWHKGDPQVWKKIQEMDKEVKLRLPEGRCKSIEPDLKESLQRIKDYDAKDFQKLFRDLGPLLAPLK